MGHIHNLITRLTQQEGTAEAFIDRAADHISVVNRLFVAGNGGSAAIVSHSVCDLMKRGGSSPVICLNDNVPMLTALGNDEGYAEVFASQLRMHRVGTEDAVLFVSSSGNSANIIRGAACARFYGAHVISMVGFDGGALKDLSHDCFHVESNSYEVIEDFHGALFHGIVQSLMQDDLRRADKKDGGV